MTSKKKKTSPDNDKIDLKKLKIALKNVLDNEEVPLKENITLNDWLELKIALNPINNFITKKLTIAFINKLEIIFKNTQDSRLKGINVSDLEKKYDDEENVNKNGYDFGIANLPIIAEVKANIPYGKRKYGSSQKTGLKKDLDGLFTKKKMAKITKEAFDETYKFLVVLDYDRNGYNTSEAVEDLIHGYSNCEEVIKIDLNDPQKLDSGHVYIVMLKPEDSNQL